MHGIQKLEEMSSNKITTETTVVKLTQMKRYVERYIKLYKHNFGHGKVNQVTKTRNPTRDTRH